MLRGEATLWRTGRADTSTICCIIQPHCQCLPIDSQGINTSLRLCICCFVSFPIFSPIHTQMCFFPAAPERGTFHLGVNGNGVIDYGAVKAPGHDPVAAITALSGAGVVFSIRTDRVKGHVSVFLLHTSSPCETTLKFTRSWCLFGSVMN